MRKPKVSDFHFDALTDEEVHRALMWLIVVFVPILLLIGNEAYELYQILK